MSENSINENLSEIKAEIKMDNKRDAVKDNIRTFALVVMAICVFTVSVCALIVMKNINTKVNAIYTKADTAVTSLNQIASDVQAADLTGMAEQLKVLTEDATNAVSTTMEKIDSIDIESLNDTIHQLDETTEAFQSTVSSIRGIFG